MKKAMTGIWALACMFGSAMAAQAVPMHVTHLWHMHQPIYFPYESLFSISSHFNFGYDSVWDGDRYNCYRDWPAGAVGRAGGHGGSQMSYSGSLAENNKSLWGDYANWAGNIRNARNNLKTSSGNPRLDMVGIAYHHSLMPLTCVESMRMQIKLHKEQYKEAWATGGAYSKGFWPPECAFDNSMVPALVAEGLDWVIVDNGHLFRTIDDFDWNSGSSCRPNKAEVRNGSSADKGSTWVGLQNVWAPTKVLAPWSYQPHYVRHVDPASGAIQKLIAVPAARYEGNENGRGGYGAFKPQNVWGSQMAANTDASKPMLLLLHSDGDNYGMKNSDAWNGQQQAFVDMCNANADFEYTSVQDYLGMFPPNSNDVIHVEPGSWIGIDGGTPYYEKWLSYENRDNEMPDMWSWSVLVAAQNRVLTADDIANSYLSGTKDMNDVEWGLGNDTAKAWHFYLNGETSCYWYWDYDRANPWDGNVTRACNTANGFALNVIGDRSNDNRGPSLFPPQRLPYNPGGKMWNETSNAPSDFVVWSFIDDVSGVQSATLKWRRDLDGQWPMSSTQNETYAGGSEVGAWQSVTMTADWWPEKKGELQVPEATARAQRYQGTISGQSDCLIDYYVEAVDGRGKTNRSNILHVWVGEQTGGSGGGGGETPSLWIRSPSTFPNAAEVTADTQLYINAEAGPAGTVTNLSVSYRVNGEAIWIQTNMTANTEWSSVGGQWYNLSLGQFAAGTVLDYFFEVSDGVTTNRDNNGGANYSLTVAASGGEPAVLWVGNVAQTPVNGAIATNHSIVITCETWRIGASTDVKLVYTTDGANWGELPFSKTGEARNNDLWSVEAGPYADGTVLRYCVCGTLPGGIQSWDNNNGNNYTALVGTGGGLCMVEASPGMASEMFDLDVSGGAATTSDTGGFGDFGHIYVNYDSTHLYVGGTDVALPTNVDNNAYVVFVSGGTTAGAANFWHVNSPPDGLDRLHNIAFNPAVNVAIVLGDIDGDGTQANLPLYHAGGPDFGQGVFATPYGTEGSPQIFSGVPGAQLIQFASYGYNNRQAGSWKCAIPLGTFGVTNAAALTNLHLSGVMVSINTNNGNNSYLSGKYLGDHIEFPNVDEQPDGFGNIAVSFVNLYGLPILPPAQTDATLGVPHSWIGERLPSGHVFTGISDYDGDGVSDRDEYFAGMDPAVSNRFFRIESLGGGRMRIEKHGGQMCTYVLDTADHIVTNGWHWQPGATRSSTNGEVVLPSYTASNLMIRVRVNVPE